eukprot:CAMPEP_0174833142 /NCGR_PEP_ID=MMETSP1114-20130205/4057_1 /TAXON_ID=312471 /ORGANISM="Neobodo designis, Strain CCAP 1951/1" /LENGTH=360 /DNA_ID=CAMNT_0016067013 /DNA_START=39 /DNA_END=1117 /DNA_ORIENTATION=-
MPSQLTPEARATIKLVARHLRGLCEQDGQPARRVAFLTGAGVSVAAGIPDFRSPGGMYDTLKPDLLTATPSDRAAMAADPTAVVSRDLFDRNQFPYFEVRRPFIVGTAERRWRPTAGHMLMRLCDERSVLRRVFTQNIDGLDHAVGGIAEERIVNVHGTICKCACELCGAPGPDGGSIAWLAAQTKTHIKDIYGTDPSAPAESKNILCPACGKAGLKPATVMYGGAMPDDFFKAASEDFPMGSKRRGGEGAGGENDRPTVDLLIVMGSSLTVMPAGGVPEWADARCKKVLFNLEPAGRFTREATVGDASELPEWSAAFGPIDDLCVALLTELGWIADAAARADVLCDASKAAIVSAADLA